jgi:glycosyltransferase involved in cell wall biosynthesis
MNLLLINNQASPDASGIARHFENIALESLSMGHSICRLVAEDASFVPKKDAVKYIYFHYIRKERSAPTTESDERIEKNRAYFKESLKQIDWSNIDLVIVGNDIYIPFIRKYIGPKKIIVIIPSSLAFSPISNPDGYKKVVERMEKNLKNISTFVLSNKMEALLRKLLGGDYAIRVAYPGVDPNRFFPAKNMGVKGDLLYLGRISKEKNIEMMIKALSLVKTNFMMKIVGTGAREDVEKLKEMIKNNLPNNEVFFLGKRKRVEKYYRENRIFILPSRYEAFGLVILEAMASGLPVIAFRPDNYFLTASDEIISDGIDGFLVRNEIEMANKIDLLLTDGELLERMGKKAAEKALGFSWHAHVEKLLSPSDHY